MHANKPIKGGRTKKSGGYHPEIARQIESDARHFGVSQSFVQRLIVTNHYNRIMRTQFDNEPFPAPRMRVVHRRKVAR